MTDTLVRDAARNRKATALLPRGAKGGVEEVESGGSAKPMRALNSA